MSQVGGHRSIIFNRDEAVEQQVHGPTKGHAPKRGRVEITSHSSDVNAGQFVGGDLPTAPAVALYHQPDEDILLLGEIMRDIALLQVKARGLPTSGVDGYRGELRVMRGAARRIIEAVDRLLGETS